MITVTTPETMTMRKEYSKTNLDALRATEWDISTENLKKEEGRSEREREKEEKRSPRTIIHYSTVTWMEKAGRIQEASKQLLVHNSGKLKFFTVIDATSPCTSRVKNTRHTCIH